MQDPIFDCLPADAPDVPDTEGGVIFHSAFDVDTVARASTTAAIGAIEAFGATRAIAPRLRPLTNDAIAATFAGHLEVDGEAPPKWADLSGYYRTGDDRLIQLHCNFDHHAQGVVDRLGCERDRGAVERAILRWSAEDLESTLIDDGMIAARLRSLAEWDTHPHAVATMGLPLLEATQIGDAPPRPLTTAARPLEGICVLDCSRVLAGPTAGQTLAAGGAGVVRIGASHLPSVPVCVMSTGFGKRNADLDLRDANDKDAFARLLRTADVWIDAFRPGALASHGFTPEWVAHHAPGTVVVQLSAFDWVGPWSRRRGFDSIVQSTTGVVDAGTSLGGAHGPTPLPVQALDYATGFLAAAAGAQLLRHQREVGGTWLVRLSLLRTRNWLVGLRDPMAFTPSPPRYSDDALHDTDSEFGRLRAAKPLFGTWTSPPARLGTATPAWLGASQSSE